MEYPKIYNERNGKTEYIEELYKAIEKHNRKTREKNLKVLVLPRFLPNYSKLFENNLRFNLELEDYILLEKYFELYGIIEGTGERNKFKLFLNWLKEEKQLSKIEFKYLEKWN